MEVEKLRFNSNNSKYNPYFVLNPLLLGSFCEDLKSPAEIKYVTSFTENSYSNSK